MRKITETVTCDVTGKPATETVPLSIDGRHVTLDLSDKHAEALRRVVNYFADFGTEYDPAPVVAVKATSNAPAIRAWALATGAVGLNGKRVGSRGRIDEGIVDAYRLAHSGE